MITRLTAGQIRATLRPGDGIGVSYRHPNAVQEGIKLATGDTEHWLCVVEGMDIVEALTIGVYRSSLYNYLKGDCDLVVKRAPAPITEQEEDRVVRGWLKRVGEHYGFGMIFGLALLVIIRQILHPLSPRLAGWAFQKLPNLFARENMPTCAELWRMEWRKLRPKLLAAYPDGQIFPSLLRRDRDLPTVAEWPGALLIED